MRFHEFGGGRVADALAPATDGDFGAEAEKPLGHRLAETCASAGDEDFFARKQAFDEHVSLPGSTLGIGGRIEGYDATPTRFRPVREGRGRTEGVPNEQRSFRRRGGQ